MNQKYNFARLYFLSLFVVMFLSACDSAGLYFDGNKNSDNEVVKEFYIDGETTLEALASNLKNEGIFLDSAALINVGEYKNLNISRIASGKYLIQPNTNVKDLLNGFTINSLGNGNAEVEVSVTFNNCFDLNDLAGKVSKNLAFDSTKLVNFLHENAVLEKYGFSKERFPAMFIPDTYKMFWDTDEKAFVERMAKVFKDFWSEERLSKMRKIGLKSQSDVVTLASIVYQEQNKVESEWKTIAGLYLNRIRNGWMLQSDPTFRFCYEDRLRGVNRLTFEHRSADCPYNTYLYAGLPPGPIYIPPAKVIDAVLNAEENSYFYMCAKPGFDGLHNFARSLNEHNRNAKTYQNWLTSQNIK